MSGEHLAVPDTLPDLAAGDSRDYLVAVRHGVEIRASRSMIGRQLHGRPRRRCQGVSEAMSRQQTFWAAITACWLAWAVLVYAASAGSLGESLEALANSGGPYRVGVRRLMIYAPLIPVLGGAWQIKRLKRSRGFEGPE